MIPNGTLKTNENWLNGFENWKSWWDHFPWSDFLQGANTGLSKNHYKIIKQISLIVLAMVRTLSSKFFLKTTPESGHVVIKDCF